MPLPDSQQEADDAKDPSEGTDGKKTASPEAVERLKARASRRGSRRGGSARGGRSSRRRLSDGERKAQWAKAVAKKARKIKHITDFLILACLALVIGTHAMTFSRLRISKVGEIIEYGPKTGFQMMKDLVKIRGEGDPADAPFLSAGTKPYLVIDGGRARDLQPAYPADTKSMLILIVPIGAALLLLLYLLDFVAWMGRPLPLLSLLYGFGTVTYLMITKVPAEGTWNIIGVGGGVATAAWFMLLVPLFLVGTFSMLRFFFSARAKRYSYAGIEAPGAASVQGDDEDADDFEDEEAPEEAPADDVAESEEAENVDDAPGDDADAEPGAPEAAAAPAPVTPSEPTGPVPSPMASAGAVPEAPEVAGHVDGSKTPVSLPGIKLDLPGMEDEDGTGDDKGDDAAGPSPFDK